MNNIPAFKTELFNLFANTTNLDAATKTKIRDRFKSYFLLEWEAAVRNGTYTDTAANRGKFYIDKLFDYTRQVVREQSNRESVAALPPPDDVT